MNRNSLYTLVGVLVIAVAALIGYLVYEQSQKPQLQITVDKSGIQVNGNG
jgi:predicted negative regulator of RcsB-dependent stress response